jgi:putative endonuclease
MTTLREGLRLGARAFGARSETLAADWLAAHGYRILARKFTIRGGEIDIIAAREDTIAFVEVKARPRMEAALAAITETKRRRLARAASTWLARNPWAAEGYALRGDAVFVDASLRPLHIEDAFGLDFEG